MLPKNLRLLLRICATSAINGSLVQKRMSVLSGPPTRRISLFTRMIHLSVLSTAFLAGPAIFFTNLKKIKGINDVEGDVNDEEQEEEGAETETPPAEGS